ncbi:winged helix-turn-helix domain-containing protein [Nitrosomonas sp. Nm33]|uniref:winged helix-turn-helix domain-containing protein n=1 Tax=Nitrosomonas sp. Nm33 TaxID=133724 RepID=UPI00089D0CA4|nr:winged helix-turn-helix domain-containing protein [Nitrosomonas sp. Nm33]SDY51696.1 two-component system, OmpR family, phosphate regulon response regulator PhoB [Nitrosomonas sp. Nm33]
MTITILTVENEPILQEMISLNLKRAGLIVLCADNAEQAKRIISNVLPDLVIIGGIFPNVEGIEFTYRLKSEERTKTIPIIMLTARDQESEIIADLDVEVEDYITKPFSPHELIARIKAVLRRRLPEMADEIIQLGGLKLDPTTHRVHAYTKDEQLELAEITLGPTEFRLLHFLMTNQERVHTRAQLQDRLWGNQVFIDQRTIDVYIRRLRTNLKTVGKEDLVQTVRGIGYRFSVKDNEKKYRGKSA